MTRDELKDSLDQIGISQVDLSNLVDVTARAVNLWMTGTRGVPGPVAAYVRLLASLPLGMRHAELSKLNNEVRTMKDGMYLIEFAGRAGFGYGTLVFDAGRIYGVDVSGGKYDGSYSFNEATRLVDVAIKVQMPAGEQSVIGVIQPFEWILDVRTVMDPSKDVGQVNVSTNLGESIDASYRFLRSLPIAA